MFYFTRDRSFTTTADPTPDNQTDTGYNTTLMTWWRPEFITDASQAAAAAAGPAVDRDG